MGFSEYRSVLSSVEIKKTQRCKQGFDLCNAVEENCTVQYIIIKAQYISWQWQSSNIGTFDLIPPRSNKPQPW